MHFLISGGTGLIGSALTEKVLAHGHKVTIITRNPQKLHAARPAAEAINLDQLANVSEPCDVVVNLAGASIAAKRWSNNYKQILRNSRLAVTTKLVEFCCKAATPPKCFLSASAIGFYGSQGDKALTEESSGGSGFGHQLCSDWELALKPLQEKSIRTCITRFGVVLSAEGGAYEKMVQPFRFKVAVKNGDGKQWFSWVAIDDAVSSLLWLINNENASGAYNVTSPEPLTNQDFTQALAKHFNTVISSSLPKFMIKILLGEMGEELLLSSQRVLPKKLIDQGFTFKNTNLQSWLDASK